MGSNCKSWKRFDDGKKKFFTVRALVPDTGSSAESLWMPHPHTTSKARQDGGQEQPGVLGGCSAWNQTIFRVPSKPNHSFYHPHLPLRSGPESSVTSQLPEGSRWNVQHLETSRADTLAAANGQLPLALRSARQC